MNDKDLNELLIENRRMRKALEFITKWELPVIRYKGSNWSYEAAKGSNGVRDYIRGVASEALGEQYIINKGIDK
jgi:hypothetical protein